MSPKLANHDDDDKWPSQPRQQQQQQCPQLQMSFSLLASSQLAYDVSDWTLIGHNITLQPGPAKLGSQVCTNLGTNKRARSLIDTLPARKLLRLSASSATSPVSGPTTNQSCCFSDRTALHALARCPSSAAISPIAHRIYARHCQQHLRIQQECQNLSSASSKLSVRVNQQAEATCAVDACNSRRRRFNQQAK